MRRFAFLLAVACGSTVTSPLGSVRFLRDSAGRVNELGIGESRVSGISVSDANQPIPCDNL